MSDQLAKASQEEDLRPLLHRLRGLIQQVRQQILRSADVVQVQTCWEIGRHIVEFEQGEPGGRSMANGYSQNWPER